MSIPLTPSDLRDLKRFTIAMARRAGQVILEGSEAIASRKVEEKKNSVDLVTEFDRKVEDLVKGEIKDAYPEWGFMGEESYSPGTPLTDNPTFIVDPIDGTTNFVHGFPYACISIGVINEKKPVLGVIYNPFLDHLYYGIKGQGSYLVRNGGAEQQLPLMPARPLPSISQAIVGVEWGSDRKNPILRSKGESFMRLAGDPESFQNGRMAHSLRSMGSAALNFAMVAQGGLDMYWEIGCWAWDVCAGIVIAQEAGAFVTGSKHCEHDGEIDEDILTGRKYLVVRGISDTPNETGLEAQKRIVNEFYATVEDVDLESA